MDEIIRLISFIEYGIDKGDFSPYIIKPVKEYLKAYLKELIKEDENKKSSYHL